jgi:hypothetical protein
MVSLRRWETVACALRHMPTEPGVMLRSLQHSVVLLSTPAGRIDSPCLECDEPSVFRAPSQL